MAIAIQRFIYLHFRSFEFGNCKLLMQIESISSLNTTHWKPMVSREGTFIPAKQLLKYEHGQANVYESVCS